MEFPDNLNDLYRRRNTHSRSLAVIAILLGTAAVMTSGWHIASIVGILGILCGLFSLGTNRQANDFAIAGLAISFIGLILTLILMKNSFFSSPDTDSTAQSDAQVSYANQQTSQGGAAVSSDNGQTEATVGSLDRLDSAYTYTDDADSSADSGYTDSAYTDSSNTDSAYTDSSNTDSAYTDSSYTDSAYTDSSSAEDSSGYTADSTDTTDTSNSAADTGNAVVTTLTDAEKEEVLGKVSVYSYPTADSYFCYVATNQSDQTIPLLHLMLNFKNGSGDVISVSTADHEQVLPGQTVVSRMEAPPSYSLYKSTAEIQDSPNAKVNHLKEIKTLYAEADDSIAVTATNNATVDVNDLEYILVFYQGEDIAAVSDRMDITSLPAGQSQTDSFKKPDAEYDTIKVYVNRAMADT